jgi:hypothetical protein
MTLTADQYATAKAELAKAHQMAGAHSPVDSILAVLDLLVESYAPTEDAQLTDAARAAFKATQA